MRRILLSKSGGVAASNTTVQSNIGSNLVGIGGPAISAGIASSMSGAAAIPIGGLATILPFEEELTMIRGFVDEYAHHVPNQQSSQFIEMRNTFHHLSEVLLEAKRTYDQVIQAYPAWQVNTLERCRFFSFVDTVARLDAMGDDTTFQNELGIFFVNLSGHLFNQELCCEWRKRKGNPSMKFKPKRRRTVSSSSSASSMSSGTDETSGSISGSSVDEQNLERGTEPLASLKSSYLPYRTRTAKHGQDINRTLKVRKYQKIKLSKTKSFMTHFEKMIEPHLFKFSGAPGDVPWNMVWDQFRKRVHVLHRSVASNEEKMQALARICKPPALTIIEPLMKTCSKEGYDYVLRFMFARFGQGFAADEKYKVRSAIVTAAPDDLDSPKTNIAYLTLMMALFTRLTSFGEPEKQAAIEVMRAIMKKLHPGVFRDYSMTFRIPKNIQEDFYLSEPVGALNHYVCYAIDKLMQEASIRGETLIDLPEVNELKTTVRTATAAVSTVQGQTSQVGGIEQSSKRTEQTSLKGDKEKVLVTPSDKNSKGSNQPKAAAAVPVKTENSTERIRYGCSFDGGNHKTYLCPLSKQEKRQKLLEQGKCFNCLAKGHRAADCPKPCQCHDCPNATIKHITFICLRQGSEAGAPLVGTVKPSRVESKKEATVNTASGFLIPFPPPAIIPFPPPPLP
ncbi:MAG TPA: C2HC-type zinc finger protein [Candidatus Nanoarchaeia archaeon]|nr:C2HC-type zinc finger protein [Candidatus Nanoarchaeia archaeon]